MCRAIALHGLMHAQASVARGRWVRSLAFDPSNEWFCTGSADRTIKIWDVATGQLKLTLTGHIEQVRHSPTLRHSLQSCNSTALQAHVAMQGQH